MPQPEMPMTPAASTDITGQEKMHTPTELSFSLGPPAIGRGDKESSASSVASVKSDSSYHPNSPAPAPSRKRARPAVSKIDTTIATTPFSLPPPPSRSRKIIQMKPGGNTPRSKATSSATNDVPSSSTTTPSNTKSKAAGGKSSGATSASKKTARKTAHSVIERRRRSKMNEEFDTMKEMIPACQGQSMHKLAILQAGIDYLRYLERCVADLKAANSALPTGMRGMQSGAPTPRQGSVAESDEEEDEDEEDEDGEGDDREEEEEEAVKSVQRRRHEQAILDDDEDSDCASASDGDDDDDPMPDVQPTPSSAITAASPAFTFVPSSYSAHPSPAISAAATSRPPTQHQRQPHYTHPYTPHSSSDQHTPTAPSASSFSRSSSLASSSYHPSPAFPPLVRPSSGGAASVGSMGGRSGSIGTGVSAGAYCHSVESSPALLPNARDEDQDREATAALLLLNCERRIGGGNVRSGSGGGAGVGGGAAAGGARRGAGGLRVQDLLSG